MGRTENRKIIHRTAERIHFNESFICPQPIVGTASGLSIQRFWHGDDLVKIHGFNAMLLTFYGFQHLMYPFGSAAELKDVCNMIGHPIPPVKLFF